MPAGGPSSSAAGCAIGCVASRRRTWTSRSSASVRIDLPGLLAPLGRVEPVGQSFPVYKVARPGHGANAIDVALPRRESKRGRGHKAFEVQGDPFMSPADAARRRDFTVNAISWDPLTDEYQDPFDGRRDLGDRLLRAVDLTYLRRRQPARPPRRAVRRSLRVHARGEHRGAVPAYRPRRSAGGADLG